MKSLYIYIAFVFTMALHMPLVGQNSEVISVPLSDPGQPGALLLNNHNGTITVEGYSGSTVEIEIRSKASAKIKKSSKRPGLRIIPKRALGISITEDVNEVHIGSSNNDMKNYVIRVPRKFSLQSSTHHNGKISVKGVIGVLEIKGHHGDIDLVDVGGSVVADTHHGEIEVTMSEIYGDSPMAFTTYHGDVEITFPESIGAVVKMKSAKGDIYTDFDINMSNQDIERGSRNGKSEIKLGGWTRGEIGGGGPELLFDTYHGDIIIRKG